jgi:hypothetical protein
MAPSIHKFTGSNSTGANFTGPNQRIVAEDARKGQMVGGYYALRGKCHTPPPPPQPPVLKFDLAGPARARRKRGGCGVARENPATRLECRVAEWGMEGERLRFWTLVHNLLLFSNHQGGKRHSVNSLHGGTRPSQNGNLQTTTVGVREIHGLKVGVAAQKEKPPPLQGL